jgi:hypothetical protein
VVGITGIVNTLSAQVARHAQATELHVMISPWRNAPAPEHPSSPQATVDVAIELAMA